MDLFSDEARLQPIPIEDGELALLHRLPMPLSNAEVFERLLQETAWRHESVPRPCQRSSLMNAASS